MFGCTQGFYRFEIERYMNGIQLEKGQQYNLK